jgi:hypothetical protein
MHLVDLWAESGLGWMIQQHYKLSNNLTFTVFILTLFSGDGKHYFWDRNDRPAIFPGQLNLAVTAKINPLSQYNSY